MARLKEQVERERRIDAEERAKTEALVVEAHNSGMTMRAIARECGLSHEGVRKMLKRHGIEA
jgi:lambda repressor-like predicted transcriptional regulator